MIKKQESEAGQSLVVFLILILLISNRNNFSDLNATALKFLLITNLSMLFQTMSMMSSITAGKKTFLGHGFMHMVYCTDKANKDVL
jgi:hypothetical protein